MLPVIKEEFLIPSSLEGNNIHVIRKHCDGGFPLLMLHGLSLPPQYNYDMPFDGISAADIMARSGIDCYMISALGYGNSSKPQSQFNRFDDWYRDISDCVSRIPIQGILGWSGSAVPAMMAARKFDIPKLVIYGIPRFRPNKDATDPRPHSHRAFTFEGMKQRRYQDIPVDRYEEILPDRWFQEWEAAIQQVMPLDMPLGTEWDRAMIRKGELELKDFVVPSKIRSDSLFVTGMWDTDVDRNEFYDLFKSIGSEKKKFRLVDGGTHWMPMETGRNKIIKIITDFLIDA